MAHWMMENHWSTSPLGLVRKSCGARGAPTIGMGHWSNCTLWKSDAGESTGSAGAEHWQVHRESDCQELVHQQGNVRPEVRGIWLADPLQGGHWAQASATSSLRGMHVQGTWLGREPLDFPHIIAADFCAVRIRISIQQYTGSQKENALLQHPLLTKLNIVVAVKGRKSSSPVQFSCSVMSDSLWPHGLQYARLSCSSPSPGVYSNSCPLSWWCHPTVSSSVVPFSSRLHSFPASGSFQMSQFFASGGQSIGVSALASVLPMNAQGWSPLGWAGWISLQSKGLSRVFSNSTVQKHQFFSIQPSL